MKGCEVIWVTHADVSEDEIHNAIDCDIDGIQLRCKILPYKKLKHLARISREITYQSKKQLSINSSIEIAQEVQADNLHLPEAMMHLCYQVDTIPVNVSVHSLEAAIKAQDSGASAVTFGPIFETPSKQIYGTPQGLEKLEEVARVISIPVYAIGGIIPRRIEACIQCGAHGVMMQNYISSKVKRKSSCL